MKTSMRERLQTLLDRALLTHSPTGREAEMDDLIEEALAGLGLTPEQDRHGNILVTLPGRESGPTLAVAAHKDELAHIVRTIDGDGRVFVEALGGSRPQKYGEGPFDILTDRGMVPAVLCMGSTHSSSLSSRTHAATRSKPEWDVVYLDCGLDRRGVIEAGVQIGDRAVPGRLRKQPMHLGDDIVCGYALDDKAAVAILLVLAETLLETPPAMDVLLAFTTAEETGCSGAAYVCRSRGVDDLIAIEIAPVAEEYPIDFDDRPVLMFKDSLYHYDLGLTRGIAKAAQEQGVVCQSQVVRSFGSDSGMALKYGLVGRSACIAYPTQNTHGYEMTRYGALVHCVKALHAALQRPW